MEQHQQAELASTAQQAEARVGEAEARVAEAELEMGSKLQALSELVDHTAKAGSQAMSHMSCLEAHTKADIQGQCLHFLKPNSEPGLLHLSSSFCG